MLRSFSLLALTWFAGSTLSAAEPIKVGVIGLDNYQAVAFTELFHNPKAEGDLKGIKVIAAFPAGSPDIPESLRELPKWTEAIQKLGVEVVKSPEDVLKQCHAVLVMSVDGRAHLEQLKPIQPMARAPLTASPSLSGGTS